MSLFQLKPSFAGGELSDSMYGRVDINKYDSGAAVLQNFIVQRYGGAKKRDGFAHVAATAAGKRAFLIPFVYNNEQSLIVEVTAGKCRFIANGSLITTNSKATYEINNTLTEADLDGLCKIKYTQSADVLFIVHPDHAPMTLTRYSNTSWVWEDMAITGGPFEDYYAGTGEDSNVLQSYSFGAGTHSFKVPDTVTSVDVELAGAGGGGGGCANSRGRNAPGGNGGGGAVIKFTADVNSSQTYEIVVGAGGKGGNGSASTTVMASAGAGEAGGDSAAFGKTVKGGEGGTGGRVYFGAITAGSNGVGYLGGGNGGAKGTDANSINGKTGSSGWCNITFKYGSRNASITPSAAEGEITLTSDKDVFETDNVGCLMSLGHYMQSEYVKGVPNTENTMVVSCLPSSSVYVESFGFWAGHFCLEKYDQKIQKWVLVRKQEGNHSQNYNFTEKNDEDHIVKFRITSTEFDTTIWTNENEKQKGFVTLQSFGNDYTGIVKITAYTNSKSVKAKVLRTIGSTEATKEWAFSPWSKSKGFPACVGFFEDRLVFAGSRKYPQTFWTSKTGDYYNFGTSVPSVDDDAITTTLNGGQMNGIKAMVAFGELILLTAGGEYKISGGGKALSPTNVMSQAQEYRGVSDVIPVTVGSRIIFIQQQSSIVRDLAYSYEADKYTGDDLNLLANHLFTNHKIVGMTYQQNPDSVIWCVRDDGILLGMTYIKEQDIYAWHRHSIKGGRFINICCIPEGQSDALYAVIERKGKYETVRLQSGNDNDVATEQFFVDDGITIRSEGIKEVTGLDWLEGESVTILADGNVLPAQEITGGKVTIASEKSPGFSVVHIGIPIESEIRTLPIEFNAQDGAYLSRRKRVSSINILFKNSRGGYFGVDEEKLDEIKWRSNEQLGAPIELFTGKKKVSVPAATWSDIQQVRIKQDDPLPMTVLALVPEIEAGG